MIIKTDGIVVKKTNYNDDDLILTINTEKMGNLVVMARGARKNKSKFLSCSQLLVKGQYDLYKGKQYYSINGCEILNGHYKIRENLISYAYGMLSSELIVKLLLEEDEHKVIYAMFAKYLDTMIEVDDNYKQILTVSFMIKLISMIGYKIDYSEIVDFNEFSYFSLTNGCLSVNQKDSTYVKIESEIVEFLIKITYIKFEDISNVYYNKEIVQNLQEILIKYIYFHTGIKELKSLEFIKEIEL